MDFKMIFSLFAGKVSCLACSALCSISTYIAPLSAATLDNWQFISDEMVVRKAERSLAPNQKKPSHVLNGHMWALFGIWDYFRVTKDVTAKRMFEDGMLALTKELPKYDLGYWSVYSQDNRVDMVGGNYQAFIIEQLRVLQSISSNPSLSSYIKRWELPLYDRSGFVELATREFLKSRQGQSK